MPKTKKDGDNTDVIFDLKRYGDVNKILLWERLEK